MDYGTTPATYVTYATEYRTDPNSDKGLLEQILEVLQNSTIAKEKTKDTRSKFWAAYKNVSGEYDDDMLERCNENMQIVLIFAGLFATVNTAFIIAMQSNPIETTNLLLVQLIQNTSDSRSATQQMTLPSSTGLDSSKFWMQALAYASLGFNLLAAYGAVMGKQWLGHYKTNRFGSGSLEDRCQQRSCKFQELKAWQFENVLRSFPVLLQISLLLFGLSLGAMLWTSQRSISVLVIAMTTFGGLCHAFVIMVSLIYPDSPFQTPVSLVIQAVFGRFRACTRFHRQDKESVRSAMTWILETSRSPEVVRSVVELIPTMSVLPDMDLMSLCAEVRDMFKACFDERGIPILQDNALAYGKALIYFSSEHDDVRRMLHTTTQEWNIWERWHILYLPQALEQCRIFYRRMGKTRLQNLKLSFQADTRDALRMVVAAGVDGFACPNDDTLIWNGQFHWTYNSREDAGDWLLECAEHFYKIGDVDAAGDALLLFSNTQIQPSYHIPDRIIPFLNDGSRRLRHIALRTACHKTPWFNTHTGEPVYLPSHPFPHAVLKAICPVIPNEGDQDNFWITNAINLLNFTKWPEDSDLVISPLAQIQLLVLLILPAPNVDNLARYTRYCHALVRYMHVDQHLFYGLASNIVLNIRHDLVKFTTAVRADEPLRDSVLPELCPTVTSMLFNRCNYLSILHPHVIIRHFRLAFTLAKSSDWHAYLKRDGYIENWITSMLTDTNITEYLRNRTRVRISTPSSPYRAPSVTFPSESPPSRTPSPSSSSRAPSATFTSKSTSPPPVRVSSPYPPFIPPLPSSYHPALATFPYTPVIPPLPSPSSHHTPPAWASSPSPDPRVAFAPQPPTSRAPSHPYQYSSTSEEAHRLFYLAGISLRLAPPEQAASCFRTVTAKHWWDLMRGAWYIMDSCSHDELDDGIESLPALVKGTEWHMPPDASKIDLESLDEVLTKTLDILRRQETPNDDIMSAVMGLRNVIYKRLAVSVVDGRS